ncbi:MAG: hypothetical protein ACREE2_17460 [Stellaceae bacterium]
MQKHIKWLWIAGFSGLVVAANAQTSSRSTPPVTAFDGTYAFVSSMKVNETYTTLGAERLRRCGDVWDGPLTIVNGHARYNKQEGTVGPQGELTMQLDPEPVGKGGGGGLIEITTSGRIDVNGTVRARRMNYYCRWDLIWQKMQSLPFPTPSNQFDGTYAFFSATNVNKWMDPAHTRRCGYARNAGPLVIVKGQANFSTAKGYLVKGTVGQQGDLAMRYPADPEVPGYVRPLMGRIGSNGTVRARQIGNWCSHDLTWQREPK